MSELARRVRDDEIGTAVAVEIADGHGIGAGADGDGGRRERLRAGGAGEECQETAQSKTGHENESSRTHGKLHDGLARARVRCGDGTPFQLGKPRSGSDRGEGQMGAASAGRRVGLGGQEAGYAPRARG